MTLDVPLSAEIEVLRQRCRDDTVTEAELIAILAKLRQGRISTAQSAAGRKSRVAIPSGEDLIDDL